MQGLLAHSGIFCLEHSERVSIVLILVNLDLIERKSEYAVGKKLGASLRMLSILEDPQVTSRLGMHPSFIPK